MKRSSSRNFLMLIVMAVLCVFYFPCILCAQEKEKIITLEEAYDLALKTHEKIMISKKEVEKSGLLTKKAFSVMMPTAEIEGSFVRQKEEIKFGEYVALPLEQWFSDFNIEQPIYQGSFFPLRKKALNSKTSSIEYSYKTIQDVLFEVANAYYEVLKAEELVENTKETLKLAEEELRVAKARFEVGEVTRTAVLRAEVDVTRAKRNLIKNNNYLKLAKDTLSRLVGIKQIEYHIIKPPTLPKIDQDYKALVSKALKHRYDYKISKLGVDIAKEDKNLVKAKYHPILSAVWSYHRVDPETFVQKDNFWDITLKVSVPIFEGGIRIWDYKEKQKSLNQAILAHDDLKKDIKIEVEDAMLTVETYEGTLDNLRKEVELSEENYHIIFERFKVGLATSLDVTDALTKLDSARTELTTTTYDYQVALLNLKKSIGLFAREYMKNRLRKGSEI